MTTKPGGASATHPSRIHEIHIRFLPQSDQRYPTLGDWQIALMPHGTDGSVLTITVTQMPDQRYAWPIALHELAEALLCHSAGIDGQAVDDWDIHGEGRLLAEPGDDPKAPYHTQHMAAGDLELGFAQALGFTAAEYADYLDTQETTNDAQ